MQSTPDFALTIDTKKYFFILAEDDQKQKTFGDGLAPMLTPQVRTDGVGYEHVPPEIEVVVPQENFNGGCGFENNIEQIDGRYSWADGLDLSSGSIIVALKQLTALTSTGTPVLAAPTKIFQSTHGLILLAGPYIYVWDLVSLTWVLRNDASADGVNFTDIQELDGNIIATRGTSIDYKTSADGITWVTYTTEDFNPDAITLRGNGSDVAALWGLNKNIIKANITPAGAGWTGGDELGGTSETTYSLLTVNNTMYAFKKEGIFSYDGANTQDVWRPTYLDAENGKHAYISNSGRIYVVYGRRVIEFNPFTNYLGTPPLVPVFPTHGMDSLAVIGLPTAIGGDENNIYIAVKNHAGDTLILAGNNNNSNRTWVWHNKLNLGAHDCNTISFVSAGVMHATNPVLVFGYGIGCRYVVFPQQDFLPYEDLTCHFETTEGAAYFSFDPVGRVKTYPKFLNRGTLLGHGLSAGRYATLKYEIDHSGVEVELVAATSDSLTEDNETDEVEFFIIRQIVRMRTGDESVTPRVEGVAIGATINPPRKRTWSPIVLLSDNLTWAEGSDMESNPAGSALKKILFAAIRKRCILTDYRDQSTYAVKLLDVQPTTLKDTRIGDNETISTTYRLMLVEMQALTSNEPLGNYDEVDYDSGVVYGES